MITLLRHRRPQVPLYGPAGTAEFGGDVLDRPAGGPEPGCLGWTIGDWWWHILKADSCHDIVAVVGAEPAVPATSHVRVFGMQGERQAGQSCLATGAAGDNYVVRSALVGMEGAGIHPAACGPAELTVEGLGIGLGYQFAKLRFAAGEEIRMHRCCAPALGRCSGRRLASGELERFPAHPLGACRARDPVWRKAAADVKLAPRRTGARTSLGNVLREHRWMIGVAARRRWDGEVGVTRGPCRVLRRWRGGWFPARIIPGRGITCLTDFGLAGV